MHALIHILTLIDILSPFFTASLPLFFHETFGVKCGLNANHFIKLVRMRTKSAIANFYGSRGYLDKKIPGEASGWNFWTNPEDIWGFCLMYKNGFMLCRKSHWDRLTNSRTEIRMIWDTRGEDKECRIWAVVWLWIPPNILANISVKCCICC